MSDLGLLVCDSHIELVATDGKKSVALARRLCDAVAATAGSVDSDSSNDISIDADVAAASTAGAFSGGGSREQFDWLLLPSAAFIPADEV